MIEPISIGAMASGFLAAVKTLRNLKTNAKAVDEELEQLAIALEILEKRIKQIPEGMFQFNDVPNASMEATGSHQSGRIGTALIALNTLVDQAESLVEGVNTVRDDIDAMAAQVNSISEETFATDLVSSVDQSAQEFLQMGKGKIQGHVGQLFGFLTEDETGGENEGLTSEESVSANETESLGAVVEENPLELTTSSLKNQCQQTLEECAALIKKLIPDYDVLLMPEGLEKESLSTLPLISMQAYVRSGQRLIYANKIAKEWVVLPITPENLAKFDAILQVNKLPMKERRTLKFHEVKSIAPIVEPSFSLKSCKRVVTLGFKEKKIRADIKKLVIKIDRCHQRISSDGQFYGFYRSDERHEVMVGEMRRNQVMLTEHHQAVVQEVHQVQEVIGALRTDVQVLTDNLRGTQLVTPPLVCAEPFSLLALLKQDMDEAIGIVEASEMLVHCFTNVIPDTNDQYIFSKSHVKFLERSFLGALNQCDYKEFITHIRIFMLATKISKSDAYLVINVINAIAKRALPVYRDEIHQLYHYIKYHLLNLIPHGQSAIFCLMAGANYFSANHLMTALTYYHQAIGLIWSEENLKKLLSEKIQCHYTTVEAMIRFTYSEQQNFLEQQPEIMADIHSIRKMSHRIKQHILLLKQLQIFGKKEASSKVYENLQYLIGIFCGLVNKLYLNNAEVRKTLEKEASQVAKLLRNCHHYKLALECYKSISATQDQDDMRELAAGTRTVHFPMDNKGRDNFLWYNQYQAFTQLRKKLFFPLKMQIQDGYNLCSMQDELHLEEGNLYVAVESRQGENLLCYKSLDPLGNPQMGAITLQELPALRDHLTDPLDIQKLTSILPDILQITSAREHTLENVPLSKVQAQLIKQWQYTHQVKKFIAEQIRTCVDFLGEAPCGFCVLDIGYLGRGEFMVGSTVNFIFLIENPGHRRDPYFQHFSQLLYATLFAVGVLNERDFSHRIHFNREVADEFKTPQELVHFVDPTKENLNPWHYAAYHSAVLFSNPSGESLSNTYHQLLVEKFSRKERSLLSLGEGVPYRRLYAKKWFDVHHQNLISNAQVFQSEDFVFDLQILCHDPLVFWCQDMALYFGLQEQGKPVSDLHKILYLFREKRIFAESFLNILESALAYLYRLRYYYQQEWMTHRSEVELWISINAVCTSKDLVTLVEWQKNTAFKVITLSQEEQDCLDALTQHLLIPMYTEMQKFLKSNEPLPGQGIDIFARQYQQLSSVFDSALSPKKRKSSKIQVSVSQLAAQAVLLYGDDLEQQLDLYKKLPHEVLCSDGLYKIRHHYLIALQQQFSLQADRLTFVRLSTTIAPATAATAIVDRLAIFPDRQGNRVVSDRRWDQFWQQISYLFEAEKREAHDPSDPVPYAVIANMPGKDNGHYSFRPEVIESLFLRQIDGHYIFKEKPSEQTGRHTALCVSLQDDQEKSHLFVFKIRPENPPTESSIKLLTDRISAAEIPCNYTLNIRFSEAETSGVAVQVFQYVSGINLRNLFDFIEGKLKKLPESTDIDVNAARRILQQLDPESFTRHLIRVLLTDPEDDKPEDYFLQPINREDINTLYRLVRIDNERAWYGAEKRVFFNVSLQVKSILYCLDLMKQPLSSEVMDEFNAVDFMSLINEWRIKLEMLGRQYKDQFSEFEVRSHYHHHAVNPHTLEEESMPTVLGMDVPNHCVEGVMRRGLIEQSFATPNSEPLKLLRRFSTVLHDKWYDRVFQQIPVMQSAPELAHERFSAITNFPLDGKSRRYSQALQVHLSVDQVVLRWKGDIQGLTKIKEWLKKCHQFAFQQVMDFIVLDGDLTVYLRLDKHAKHEVIKFLKEEVVKRGNALPHPIAILEAYAAYAWHEELDLSAFEATLRDEQLSMVIANSSTTLKRLTLKGCHHLSENGISNVLRTCLELEFLDLTAMNQLRYLGPVMNHNIQALVVDNCNQLMKIEAELPELIYFSYQDCATLDENDINVTVYGRNASPFLLRIDKNHQIYLPLYRDQFTVELMKSLYNYSTELLIKTELRLLIRISRKSNDHFILQQVADLMCRMLLKVDVKKNPPYSFSNDFFGVSNHEILKKCFLVFDLILASEDIVQKLNLSDDSEFKILVRSKKIDFLTRVIDLCHNKLSSPFYPLNNVLNIFRRGAFEWRRANPYSTDFEFFNAEYYRRSISWIKKIEETTLSKNQDQLLSDAKELILIVGKLDENYHEVISKLVAIAKLLKNSHQQDSLIQILCEKIIKDVSIFHLTREIGSSLWQVMVFGEILTHSSTDPIELKKILKSIIEFSFKGGLSEKNILILLDILEKEINFKGFYEQFSYSKELSNWLSHLTKSSDESVARHAVEALSQELKTAQDPIKLVNSCCVTQHGIFKQPSSESTSSQLRASSPVTFQTTPGSVFLPTLEEVFTYSPTNST